MMRVATLAACLLAATLTGCYRPNVSDGGFKCAAAGSKRCPDGFLCDWDNVCKRMRTDAGAEAKDAPDGSTDAVDAMDAPDAECFMPKAGCDPADGGAMCDPVCQTGCNVGSGCRQKCATSTSGMLTCNDVVPGTLRTELQPCNIINIGMSTQTDACAPGLVCLEDACGVPTTGRCYKYCRTDNDCPDSQCSKAVPGTTLRACDVPNADMCTPTVGGGGCKSNEGCYIAISRPEHTVCDCPGSILGNESCFGSRGCFPGLLCVDPTGGIDTICLQVCQLSKNGTDCPGANQTCHPYSGNTGGAKVNPTYGFCF